MNYSVLSVLNSGILSNPLQSSPNCRQSPIHRPTARIPRALAIWSIPYNSDNPYESENSENPTENPTLMTARIPRRKRESLATASLATATILWDSKNSENTTENPTLMTATIPSDSDNPYDSENSENTTESLTRMTARIPSDTENTFDSENTFRYREYLPTPRIPRTLTITRITCNSDNPYDSENTTENPTLTTARITCNSDNPYDSENTTENPTLTTVRIPGDSDNPYNSENIKRQREYLPTARTPARIPPLQLRESLATATIPTTMRIPGDSENPTDLSNVIGPWNIPGVDYT